MKKFHACLTAVVLSVAVSTVAVDCARAADDAAPKSTSETVSAAKIAAKEKWAQTKAMLAEKAKQASDAAQAAYAKAKVEYDAAQTPEAKAKREATISATKLAAKEKWAQAKAMIADKSQKLADAAKAEYEKYKASQDAAKAATPAKP